MTPPAIRVDLIGRVLARKCIQHPELSHPLRWSGLRRICEREDVGLLVQRLPRPRPAELVPYSGTWTIVLSSDAPARRHTYYAAHELAHLWLHHDPVMTRSAKIYTFDDWSCPDPREDEAEHAATWMLADPRVRAYLDQGL